MPRQALALAGWVLLWLGLEAALGGLGLGPRRQLAAWLAALAAMGGAAALAAPGWLFRLLTSVRFAVTQGAFLIAAALLGGLAAGAGRPGLCQGLWFCSLLALLSASMLAVTWKRRPYTLARLGFLLVHVAPTLVLLGALWGRCSGTPGRGSWLVGGGFACLLIGCAWMFYLKPALKRREAKP
jgi:hypothetical protein